MGPQPSGPAPHFHRSITESFFVLAGTVRLYDGPRWVDAAPGDFRFVPEGGVHGFRNECGARRFRLGRGCGGARSQQQGGAGAG